MNRSMMNAAESLKILVSEVFETRDAAPGIVFYFWHSVLFCLVFFAFQ